MTVVPIASALPEGYTGMDDLSNDDLTMPRLQIGSNERAGVFIDGLSGEHLESVDVIILGIVKQRILWPSSMGATKSQPLCRSLDFETGTPDPGNDEFKSKFPWAASGYDEATVAAEGGNLSCAACPLKEWGSHPDPDKKAPWCNEQIVLAILLGPAFAPAILTVQGSNLKPTKSYLTSFKRDKLPPFTCHTKITLDVQTRGTVTYSVATFTKAEATDQALWGEYVTTYQGIERFVKTPRVREDAVVEAAAAPAAPTAAATPTPAAPAAPTATPEPASAVATPDDDEGEIPF